LNDIEVVETVRDSKAHRLLLELELEPELL